ncbi:tetratricopeptide repeat protein [Kingella oralis]|jgi:hypothetical protein|uniref:tetratricopeptide repeat protein n=1 Tax=Kingella oralis TaxID=505 RepID=UPI002D80EF36|nr:hypothetical protein [Kingella oralis]
MKKALFTALLAALGAIASPAAQAAPYPPHDIMSIVRPDHIDMPLADKVMSDLYDHVGNYPPRFDNDADRQRAQAEAAQLNRLFAGIIKVKAVTPQQPEKYINVLYRLARLNAMAHNMDMPNAAAQADRYFEEMIKLLNGKPKEKARAQGEYGAFLVGSNRIDRAMPLLQQAVKGGDGNAHLPLGMAYLMKGKQAEAVKHLQTHQKNHPQDERARVLLEAIEKGTFKVHRVNP